MRKGLLALLPLVLVLAACRTGVTMWDTCSTPTGSDPTGTDGAYVLVCNNGRWEPIMTAAEYIEISRGEDITIAPLPEPPVEAPTTTTPPTTTPPAPTTTVPPEPDNLVSAGNGFTCAVVDGAAKCWGVNGWGQLGDASAGYSTDVPTQVQGLTSGVTAISAANDHACAVVDGAAKCWGANGYSQLGATISGNTTDVPTQVQGLTSGVTAISAGGYFTCAIVDGAAKCWGRNSSGQLGIPATGNAIATPVQVQGLTSGVTAISAGYEHACAVVDGAVKCWGSNSSLQLGDAGAGYTTDVPTQVQGLTSGVTAVSAGTSHSCAVVAGAAKCWGKNDYGQLGTPTSTAYTSAVPIQVGGLTSGVTAIGSGDGVSCAVTAGAAKCWGKNSIGQLGTPTASVYSTEVPVQVTGLLAGVSSISTGPGTGSYYGSNGTQTCAVVDRGIDCWGLNSSGQLGTPSSTYNSADPIVVPLV